MPKKIVVILRKPPHGSLFAAEGLRAAVAVSASDTTVVSIEDSIYAFLKNVDVTLYRMHLDFLKEAEIPIFMDKDSLKKRGLRKEDLSNAVEVKEHHEILNILSEADATITF